MSKGKKKKKATQDGKWQYQVLFSEVTNEDISCTCNEQNHLKRHRRQKAGAINLWKYEKCAEVPGIDGLMRTTAGI